MRTAIYQQRRIMAGGSDRDEYDVPPRAKTTGVEIYDAAGGYAAGFAQRRLSIMDLSPLGHRRCTRRINGSAVVFNGEIITSLKKELSGIRFAPSVIRRSFWSMKKWAMTAFPALTECLRSPMTGMRRKYILCGPCIGKKPPHYWEDGKSGLASELKPILAVPGF